MLRVQAAILNSARDFFGRQRFTEIVAPVLALETDPGIREATPAFTDLYGMRTCLTTSMNVQKFAAVASLDRVFSVSPAIRIEPVESVRTHRHLTEFRILEIEMACATLDELLELCESFVCTVIDEVRTGCEAELSTLNRVLIAPRRPFRRLRFGEAIELLRSRGFDVSRQREIPWEAEEELSRALPECFWLTHFPNGSRGFYDRVDPAEPKQLLDMDLIYPEGFGEACSGGEREHTYAGIRRQMLLTGCDPKEFEGKLELAQGDLVPSAGCGFGLERLTRYICGLASIWDAVPFPKAPSAFSR